MIEIHEHIHAYRRTGTFKFGGFTTMMIDKHLVWQISQGLPEILSLCPGANFSSAIEEKFAKLQSKSHVHTIYMVCDPI